MSRLPEFVKEVLGEAVFFLFDLLFGHGAIGEEGHVETVLLRSHAVQVEELNDFRAVLPRPRAQDPWAVDRVACTVVVEQWVEVDQRRLSHGSPQSAHFELCLVVHMSHELLTVFKFHVPLLLLLTEQVGTLLRK